MPGVRRLTLATGAICRLNSMRATRARDPRHQVGVEAGTDASVLAPAPVDEREQDAVQVVVEAPSSPSSVWPGHRSADGGLARICSGTPRHSATARSWLLYRSPIGWMAAAMSPCRVP